MYETPNSLLRLTWVVFLAAVIFHGAAAPSPLLAAPPQQGAQPAPQQDPPPAPQQKEPPPSKEDAQPAPQQDPPPATYQNPPSVPPDGDSKRCGEEAQVYNRTEADVRVTYAYRLNRSEKAVINSIASRSSEPIRPVYCPSILFVATEGDPTRYSHVDVKPGGTYEVVWSDGEDMYVVREAN